MRCTSPRTVGFLADGKTISWSQKNYSKEYAIFQLPCGKCLECRLDYARQWAVRCVHEAKMHEKNSFVTLTYDDEHLTSPKLVYDDFQLFMKRLRKTQNEPIGMFVTGEYGDQNLRPHWHAILFGYRPSDGLPGQPNKRGDILYTSDSLSRIWGKGRSNYGEVTFESAGYCARYAAKKIVHTQNNKIAEADHHEWQPISKKSSKHAIGKKFLEKHWPDVFLHGQLILDGRDIGTIPRYYEKWLKEHHPTEWLAYVTRVKLKKMERAQVRADQTQAEWEAENHRRLDDGKHTFTKTENERRKIVTDSKFEQLVKNHKL